MKQHIPIPKEKVLLNLVRDKDLIGFYTKRVTECLTEILIKMNITNINESISILVEENETLVNNVVSALMSASDELPKNKYRRYVKPYWNKALTDLKKEVKKWWHKWIVIGRPRDDTNETYNKCKDCKKQYRQAVCTAEKSYERKWAQEVLNTGEVDQKTFWYFVNKRRKLDW